MRSVVLGSAYFFLLLATTTYQEVLDFHCGQDNNTFIAKDPTQCREQIGCKYGKVRDIEYKIIYENETFEVASSKCILARVLSVQDSEMLNCVTNLQTNCTAEGAKSSCDTWIGMRLKPDGNGLQKSDYEWVNGTDETTDMNTSSLWVTGEPSSQNQLRCVQLWRKSSFKWDDIPCERERRYICEEEVRKCKKPPNIGNGTFLPYQFDYIEGENVSYKCNDKFSISADTTIVCQRNGSWSLHKIPTCKEDRMCRDLPNIPNAKGEPQNQREFKHGDFLNITCNLEFHVDPPGAMVECKNGKWMNNGLKCTKNEKTSTTSISGKVNTSPKPLTIGFTQKGTTTTAGAETETTETTKTQLKETTATTYPPPEFDATFPSFINSSQVTGTFPSEPNPDDARFRKSIKQVEEALDEFLLYANSTNVTALHHLIENLEKQLENLSKTRSGVFNIRGMMVYITNENDAENGSLLPEKINITDDISVKDVKVPTSKQRMVRSVIAVVPFSPQNIEALTHDSHHKDDSHATYMMPINGTFFSVAVYPINSTEFIETEVEYEATLPEAQCKRCKSFQQSGLFERSKTLDISPACAFVDYHEGLSESGCVRESCQGSTLTCKCNHTTAFAVLLSTNEETVIPVQIKMLNFITETISVVFLFITGVILWKLRKGIRGNRPFIQVNLCVALFLLHILLLFHDTAFLANACEPLVFFVHYFLLASAMWMLIEGMAVLSKTLDSSFRGEDSQHRQNAIRAGVAWGIPILIVVPAAGYAIPNEYYIDKCDGVVERVCWLSNRNGLLVAGVIIPISIIFLINLTILMYIGAFVFRMTRKTKNFRPSTRAKHNGPSLEAQHIRAVFRALLMLIPALGIPWILAFFVGVGNQTASLVFMYVQSVINGLQGFLLFVIYILLSSEVRKVLLQRWNRTLSLSRYEMSHRRPNNSSGPSVAAANKAFENKYDTNTNGLKT